MTRAPSTAHASSETTAKATGRLPDFLIIGAAKSGTTTLYYYLVRHPRIFLPQIKEPEFFSRDDVFDRGLDWYQGLFAPASDDQLCGEASTTYTRWPHTADAATRIGRTLPDARLIYIMRHPVDRAYSHYAHHMRKNVTCTFEEALERDDIYLDCSRYADQIARYDQFFPRDRMLFLFLEDLRRDPKPVLAKIQRFLGVEERELGEKLVANKSGAEHFLRRRTTYYVRWIPGLRPLLHRVPKKTRDRVFDVFRSTIFARRIEKEFSLPPMLPETRRRLLEEFREPNQRLAETLNMELPDWSS